MVCHSQRRAGGRRKLRRVSTTHGGSRLQRGPEQSRKTSRASSIPCRHQKGWNKKGQLGGQERDSRLFMTISEKAQGTAKSGLRGGVVLNKRKAQKKTSNVPTRPSPPVSPRETPRGSKSQTGLFLEQMKEKTQG